MSKYVCSAWHSEHSEKTAISCYITVLIFILKSFHSSMEVLRVLGFGRQQLCVGRDAVRIIPIAFCVFTQGTPGLGVVKLGEQWRRGVEGELGRVDYLGASLVGQGRSRAALEVEVDVPPQGSQGVRSWGCGDGEERKARGGHLERQEENQDRHQGRAPAGGDGPCLSLGESWDSGLAGLWGHERKDSKFCGNRSLIAVGEGADVGVWEGREHSWGPLFPEAVEQYRLSSALGNGSYTAEFCPVV